MTNPMTPSTNPARDEAVLKLNEAVQIARDAIDAFENEMFHAGEVGERPDLWDQTVDFPIACLREFIAALSAAPAPASGVDAVAVKALGPIPQFDSFAINPVGEEDICVEGSSRFAHERDVAKLFKWARAAQALLTSLPPSATSGSEAGGDDPKEIRDLAWKMWCEDQPGIIWTLDNKRAYREKARAALAKPSSPAGSRVEQDLRARIDELLTEREFLTSVISKSHEPHCALWSDEPADCDCRASSPAGGDVVHEATEAVRMSRSRHAGTYESSPFEFYPVKTVDALLNALDLGGQRECEECSGTGHTGIDGDDVHDCPACAGTGRAALSPSTSAAEPVAWQWRWQFNETGWSRWEMGEPTEYVLSTGFPVERRPLYAHPAPAAVESAQGVKEACAQIADARAHEAIESGWNRAKSRTGRDKANAAAHMAQTIAADIRASLAAEKEG